ncbi:Serine/threonine protein kinase [Handroanthus impetiginosus]|uniref:Serine/threonine protein kinase n=1 Tax=Handroanthus impetiginosus TaxID=429701 RepID=A0A2G9GEM3_9LAMI|nr:Serine/threonine protein kinase [Handroanthus impetiginosus]
MKDFLRCKSPVLASLMICCFYLLDLSFCWSLKREGVALLRFKEKVESDPHGALLSWSDEVGVESPCSWFGVECSQGRVVALNLKDLCLRGTLAPDIGELVHIKSIILRNNSFSGAIPEEIVNLKELEVLDLGYNNFSGQNSEETRDIACRKLSQEPPSARRPALKFLFPFPLPPPAPPPPPESVGGNSPTPPPSPSLPPAPAVAPPPLSKPNASSPLPSPITPISPSSLPSPAEGPIAPTEHSRKHNHRLLILSTATGVPLLLFLVIGIYLWQSGKVATVKPWATGLSGQLQKAFVTGVPKLKRSELEAACEDFSNVIGSLSLCTLYKGTLSSGVEIAVASIAVASAKEWSNSMEAQFRKKIDTLSKVNHKNFVGLLGYCVEDEPFTRMMVFEYAPNGTLFEHLHIREAEHLNWETRLRIAMGIAYCLEHMHQLNPPLAHRNFNSSAVYLTEDYAAKVSDFVFLDEGSTSRGEPTLQGNVYSFGVVLFEMITGKLPYSSGSDSLQDWASDYLSGGEMVDPTLETCREDQLRRIGDVIKSCVNPDPRCRPTMSEICASLREITGIEPDGAIPRASPLWWAEVEILSTEAS